MKAVVSETNYNVTKLVDKIIIPQTEIPTILDLSKFKYLQWVECTNSFLSKIINLCRYITYLDCKLNYITKLDNLPKFLNTLNCSSNKLTSLNNLPEKLSTLICSSNNIIHLDNLPFGLKYLDCSYCDIINLENLPIGLKELICSDSKINNLNFLPESIISLTICHTRENFNYNFSLDLENLPKSTNVVIVDNPTLLNKITFNKNIWNFNNKNKYIKKTTKNNEICNKDITFCPNPSEFGSNELCNCCNDIIINCKCNDMYCDWHNCYNCWCSDSYFL